MYHLQSNDPMKHLTREDCRQLPENVEVTVIY